MNSPAWRSAALDRLCVPTCTIRPYFWAAATICRPSQMLYANGFST
jgi:hypothetical protein